MANEAEKGFLSKIKSGVTKSAQWFKDKVKEYQKIAAKYSGPMARRAFIKGDKSSEILTGQPIVGRMYLFQYDAKFKDILPYWDVWPLIFPFDYAKNGFYGINLHYLPPAARHNLLVALGGNQDSTKNQLSMSYNIITKFAATKPCVKRYLFSHVQGKGFYGISGEDWSYAAALPLQKFRGATSNTVWKHSATMY